MSGLKERSGYRSCRTTPPRTEYDRTQFRPLMRPRTTLLGITFASSLHSFGMQTSEFRPRGAGALGGIKGRLGLSLEVGHDVAGDQLEALGGRRRVRPIMAEQQIATEAAV